MEKDKYSLLKERIVKRTGIETITITIEAFSLIVDDYSIPECLVHVGNYYGAMAVYEGDNSKVGITEQDLIDFNILQPIEIDNDIQQSYPVISPYGTPIVNEIDGDNLCTLSSLPDCVFITPEITWKHPGLADSTIESLKKEHDIDNVLAKIDLNCNLPLHTTNDVPMFDPAATENLTNLCRTFNNSFKMGIADKIMETLKPKKEILKIFNKLIEQFKNITKKDFKRLRTYVISGKDDYKTIKFSTEYIKTMNYIQNNALADIESPYFDNIILDIRRIILEGKPTVKFNLNIEEFNLFKKWLLDNSERIEDGN